MTRLRRVLICEDRSFEANRYLEYAAHLGWSAVAASNADDALALLHSREFDTLLTDISLGRADDAMEQGFRLIAETSRTSPGTVIVAMSAHPDNAVASRALSLGAMHFMRKPILGAEELLIAFRLASDRALLQREESARERALAAAEWPHLTDELRTWVDRVARHTAIPTIVIGETGTGKETLARCVHRVRTKLNGGVPVPYATVRASSLRAQGDRAALTLLGEVGKGNEGGPERGVFADADGGLLVIDEVGRLDLRTQELLLRPLAEGRYTRLGCSDELSTEFQTLCLSSIDLDTLVAQGQLLPELRSLLWGHELRLLPLRERVGELEPLVAGRLRELGVAFLHKSLAPFCARLAELHWQGNIRQLFRVVDLVVAVEAEEASGTVQLDPQNVPFFPTLRAPETDAVAAIPSAIKNSSSGRSASQAVAEKLSAGADPRASCDLLTRALEADLPLYATLEELEKALLRAAITRHGGNMAQVCRALVVPRSTLDLKRKRFDI